MPSSRPRRDDGERECIVAKESRNIDAPKIASVKCPLSGADAPLEALLGELESAAARRTFRRRCLNDIEVF
jgi:hypothetical protein